LLQKTSAIDVYFEDEIEILVPDPDDFPVEAVREVLNAREIAFSAIAPASI